MEALGMLFHGFGEAITPINLLMAVAGALVGTLVGMLPGLGPTSAIAILLPLTTVLQPTQGVIMLAGIYYGAMYGGSTTSILLNIPGEVSSVPTCLDGYPLAKQGRGGPALGIAAIGSFAAGTLGVIGLVFFAPILADQALKFGPPEYFALMILALTVIVNLSGGQLDYQGSDHGGIRILAGNGGDGTRRWTDALRLWHRCLNCRFRYDQYYYWPVRCN
jgi:putative tricarboxylic transport membrane protein